MKNQSCAGCLFYDAAGDKTVGQGICRHGPPQLSHSVVPSNRGPVTIANSGYPVVVGKDVGCGQYKRLDMKEAPPESNSDGAPAETD